MERKRECDKERERDKRDKREKRERERGSLPLV